MSELKEMHDGFIQELKNEWNKAKGKELTPTCLDNMYKLIECVKGIDKIEMLEDESEHSSASYRQRNYSGRRSYYSRHSRMDRLEEELERLMDEAPNDRVREAIDRALSEIR